MPFVGNEVICIVDFNKIKYRVIPSFRIVNSNQLPQFKKCYIITKVTTSVFNRDGFFIKINGFERLSFAYFYFRPIIKKSQEDDIQIFNKIKDETKNIDLISV